MRTLSIILGALILPTAAAQNLLANPGFDTLDLEGTPKNWDLFVMPGNNARGQADRIAHDGDYAITLKTPTPYEQDPINNWSQVIFDDLRGKKVSLSGSIRTQSVGNAGLWIQCFSRDSRRPLIDAATMQDTPLNGTHGWTSVTTDIIPPPETDFIMIRCFLLGTGQAWFDSLTLTAEEAPPEVPLEAMEPAIEALPTAEAEPAIDPRDIIAVSQAMQQTIRELEESNRMLMEQIANIQDNLDNSRVELEALNADTLLLEPAHPLVPYDFSRDRTSQ